MHEITKVHEVVLVIVILAGLSPEQKRFIKMGVGRIVWLGNMCKVTFHGALLYVDFQFVMHTPLHYPTPTTHLFIRNGSAEMT